MPPTFFSMSFVTVETNQSRDATRLMAPRRAMRLLDEHRPWAVVDNMALVIMNQTYSALLEILGPAAAPPPGADGHVQLSRPVDPADPDSPLLTVNASAAHCCISLTNSGAHGGATPEYARFKSPRQKSTPQHRLARATVSVAQGTLHLASAGGGDHYWRCAEVWPDVSGGKGLLGVLETIKKRLDAAIRLEARMMEMARACGCRSSAKVGEIAEVCAALEKMRAEVDLDAIMRRRCQKRRCRIIVQEIGCGPEVDQEVDDAEVLTKRFRALHVSRQKRPRRVEEISCRWPAADMDDAEMLSKRLRIMHV